MNQLPAWLSTDAFVDGAWKSSASRFAVLDPATGNEIATVPDLSPEEVEIAVAAAHRALPAWSAMTAKERGVLLRRWHDLIMAHADDLAAIMTAEQGKPLAEARGEVAYGASFIDWFAEEAKRAYGRTIPTTAHSRRYLTIKQPVGVVAAITPWNFPVAMITRKAGPALAAGCTIVVKPPAETPLSALAIAKLASDAGIPAGVLNIVTSLRSAAVGQLLCDDPRVRKLSFTGSTEIGKILYAQCAGTVKKLSLELGGNAPLIVFDDANLDEAVAGAVASKFRNAGQTCVCANRMLVQSGIHDRFVAALSAAVGRFTVAPGDEAGAEIGPLINDEAVAKVEELVTDAVNHGATISIGGAKHLLGGRFYAPTVMVGVTPKMRISGEEIFGPVATIARFEEEDDAVAMANATSFGLAAYLFTRDIGRAMRVAERIEAGMVGVNEGVFSSEVVPFGGIKESGLGREGAAEGLDEYLETKMICLGGI